MKHTITILTILWIASSCATLLNEPTTYVHVQTTKPSIVVVGRDSLKTYRNKVLLNVPRSKDTLKIITISESIKNQTNIESKNSIAYRYNIFTLGVGFIFDKYNPKRYDYPRSVLIDVTDNSVKNYRYMVFPQKGDLFFHFSLPYINNFYFKPENEKTKRNTGFMGISAGLDYYYQNNRFINFSASGVMDFLIPFPAPFDYEGEYESMGSAYLSLSNNHKIGRFSFGYGITLAKNSWFYRNNSHDTLNPVTEAIDKRHNTLGLNMSTYFHIGRKFNIGVIYRPTFFIFRTEDKFEYEHLISIDFAWKIPIKY